MHLFRNANKERMWHFKQNERKEKKIIQSAQDTVVSQFKFIISRGSSCLQSTEACEEKATQRSIPKDLHWQSKCLFVCLCPLLTEGLSSPETRWCVWYQILFEKQRQTHRRHRHVTNTPDLWRESDTDRREGRRLHTQASPPGEFHPLPLL